MSFLIPTVYNICMAKLYGSNGILAQTRVVVKAETDNGKMAEKSFKIS
jgi:hypothetical protein